MNYLYIPRFREEENYVIVSKKDGSMDFYSKESLEYLNNKDFDSIEKYRLFNLDNILKLKKEGKLEHFFSEEYLNQNNPLKILYLYLLKLQKDAIYYVIIVVLKLAKKEIMN